MRRARASEVVLIVVLLSVWAVATALHIRQVVRGELAWVSVYVQSPADSAGYPTVRGFWPGAASSASGALEIGDRVLKVGEVDLRGVGPVGFAARVYAAAAHQRHLRIPLTYERAGTDGRTTIWLVPVTAPWLVLLLTCTLVGTATLVLVRRPGLRIARAFFLLAIAYALHWTFFFGGPPAQTYAWAVVFFVASVVMLPLIVRAALIFPADVAPAERDMPRWPWLFALFGPISTSWLYGIPLPPAIGFPAVFAFNVVCIVVLLAILTRNYRRADALGRRQLKWILLGIYVGTAPMLFTDAAAAFVPSLWRLHEVVVVTELVIPVCMLIAIVRTNILDVDRLITGAAVYSVLSIVLLATALTTVPQIARATSEATAVDPHTVQLVLSVLIASCMVPGQKFLQPRIERLLFRERHALRAGVEALLQDLGAAAGPAQLLTLAGERLDALVRPRACVIYAPLGDRFAAVVARGTDPDQPLPTLAAESAAVSALRARTAPLDVTRWALLGEALADDERTALERLRAAVLLPVRHGGELAAVICLGAKRSGDIYTETDMALLAAVADKIGGELLRFDTAAILDQERRMSHALRRYVPEPVAARLTRGQTLEGGERDVSVLFVDIRGYTTYSEARAADTVFTMVNQYTEAVSAVIQDRGGTVVEFLGDGLMAVFGAPEAMPDHARVSVQAACEVVATVGRLALDAGDGAPISVGVGIASGPAFVGNIRTSDRLVYTAVGDVVNLASRIQGLTRDLHAAIAIDARTHDSAGDPATRFERHGKVQVRGRVEPVDLYLLPAVAA